MAISFDPTDLRILDTLQQDASLSNQALAEKVHVSPATCMRRVRRLTESGVIERTVAVLSPQQLGAGLIAILEVTLEQQTTEWLDGFETRVTGEPSVQQCYRVASGADFVLIIQVKDMDAYHALAHRLFTGDAHVRNVRTFFSIKRAKFGTQLVLPSLR